MKPAKHTGLTFQWADILRAWLRLPKFILLSIFLHALAFYIFQVAYPSSVSITPPPAQASLMTPATPGYEALTRWIEAEDPSIVMKPPAVFPGEMIQAAYRPSFESVRSAPKPAEPEADQTPVFPPAKDALSLVGNPIAKNAPPPRPLAIPPSAVRFSGGLAEREIRSAPPVHLENPAPLSPTSLLVGVTGRGEVRYIFLQTSCGDKTADRRAESHLAHVDFAPGREEITWGVATYFWGNDHDSGNGEQPGKTP